MADTADPMTRAGASQGRRPGRVLAVDAARAVAIVGMVVVNVGPMEAGGLAGWVYDLPHGRASILFVLLAGIGFSLMTRRVRESGGSLGAMWAALGWRCAVLLLGGLALQRMGHEVNVILAVYALLFVLAGVLTRARDGVLLAVVALATTVGPLLWLAPQVSSGAPFAGRPPQLGDPPVDVLTSVLLTGPYPLVTWMGPFALGMWLGRRELTDPAFQRRTALLAAGLALTCELLARTAAWLRGGLVGDTSWELLLTDAPHGQMPLWLVGATASSVLVLVVCLLVERHLGPRLLRPLAQLGQLSLTVYVLHLVALAGLRPLPHTLAQGALISAALVLAAAAGALAWRRYHRRGPLEVLLRPPWTWHGRSA